MVEATPLLAQRANSTQRTAVTDPGPAVLNLWLFFNIGPSHVLLPLLCISLLLLKGRRNLLLLNVAVTWIICGFASSLLLYAGRQTGPEPSSFLCTIQASLLYAIPPLTSTAVFSLVLGVWINLCWKRGEPTRGFYFAFLLVGPYVVYFTFAALAARLGSQDPSRVSRKRRFFYCSIKHNLFSRIVVIYAAIMLLNIIALLSWIGVTLWRNNKLLRAASRMGAKEYADSNVFPNSRKGIRPDDIQFALRLAIFGVYIFIGLTLSFLSIASPTSAAPDMIFATMGLAVFLVFGTQPQLWLAWRDLFSRPRQEDSHVPTLTPFELPPGQQNDPEAQIATIPPPVPEKPWMDSSQVPQYAGSTSAAALQQPFTSENRVPAVRFQVARPRSTATIVDHPYRNATSPESEPMPTFIVPMTSAPNAAAATTVNRARGTQPLNSSSGGPSPGRGLLSYENQTNLRATAAAMSYSDRGRPAPSEPYDTRAPPAASYQSRYVASRHRRSGSGNVTYRGGSGDNDDTRSSNGSLGTQFVMDERTRRADPVVPRV